MDQTNTKTKSPRRRLNKDQLVEILERNAALYKDEETFIRYMVDLTLYLVEYEFDWSKSEANQAQAKTSPEPENTTGGTTSERMAKKIYTSIRPIGLNTNVRQCPYCGASVGEQAVCPSCHNLAR